MGVHSKATGWSFAAGGKEHLRRPVVISAGAHVLLATVGLASSLLHPAGATWGEGGPGGAATLRLVSAASVPLPAPSVSTDSRLATENPGLHRPDPTPPAPRRRTPPPPPPEPEKVVDLPSRNARRVASTSEKPPEKPPEPPKPSPAPQPQQQASADVPPPPRPQPRSRNPAPEPQTGNEVPFGEGGPAQGPFGVFSTDSGTGGLSFEGGSGDFAGRFGWYVTAIRNRVSNNWLKGTIDPGVRAAPRVYVSFQILRNGQVVNAQLTSSSGVASLDRSAIRAIYDSSPMPPLPGEYGGPSVNVEFWFDFRR
jgi:TonB family protein